MFNIDKTFFKKLKLLVVGDVMVDEYRYGSIDRISPEFPVPILKYFNNEYRLGGALNVANNLSAIGCKVDIFGRIGNDSLGDFVINSCNSLGINTDLLIRDNQTICKTRYINQNNVQILRVDVEDTVFIKDEALNSFIEYLCANIKKYNGIFICDYLKGMLTDELTEFIIDLANKNNVKTFVDVKAKNKNKYKNCYLLKPNRKEFEALSGKKLTDDTAKSFKKSINVKNLLVTLGSEGMFLLQNNNRV